MAIAGQRLDAMSPVYRLADLSELWLEINVPQEQLTAVRPGMKVSVTGSPVRSPAAVTTIGRSIDPATQAITVRATLTESGHGLKPGQFVSAQIVADHGDASAESVWMLPAAAVTRRGDAHFIFVRTRDGFEILEVLVISTDTNAVYFDAEIDASSRVAAGGVAALKAFWLAQSGTS
jgi:cobalt-zinc-cadmium efflux system membrane fusion protein